MSSTLDAAELKQLENAVVLLEFPGFIARVADVIGTPVEKAIQLLPEKVSSSLGELTQAAVMGSLRVALATLDTHVPGQAPPEPSNGWHKLAAAVSGGAGGAFGVAALAVELPLSTTLMMRSIADVARSEGADLSHLPTLLECVQVLALGGPSASDDASEAGYFATRMNLARMVTEASAHLLEFGLEREGAPVLVRLILAIAERYAVPVSAKAAAQAVPALGAVGGALVNTLFMDHFQGVARGHFTVRRLEQKYGPGPVQAQYAELRRALKARRSRA
jgi:hypothetical protein